MSTYDLSQHGNLPSGAQARFARDGNVYVIARALADGDGNLVSASHPLPTQQIAGAESAVTYGAMQTAAMGNGSAVIVVPANADRRQLIITNVSETTGYLSIGDDAVTTTTYTYVLDPDDTLVFTAPLSTQAIWAADVSADDQNLVYQEAM